MHKFDFFYVISQSETRNNKKKVIFIMDLTGRVIAVLPANSGVSARTGNPWMSQEYVIEVPGQYPRKCLFRIFGEDRIKQFNIQMGEDITVSFDIDAHEYQGRWQLRSLPSRLLLLTTVLHHSLLPRNPLVKVRLTICPSKGIGNTKNKPKARVDAQVLGFIFV